MYKGTCLSEILHKTERITQGKRIKIIKYIVGKTLISPVRAILLHSPGRKPWVNQLNTFFEPRRGGTLFRKKTNTRTESAAPYRSSFYFYRKYPGFCSCLWHSRHPGL